MPKRIRKSKRNSQVRDISVQLADLMFKHAVVSAILEAKNLSEEEADKHQLTRVLKYFGDIMQVLEIQKRSILGKTITVPDGEE